MTGATLAGSALALAAAFFFVPEAFAQKALVTNEDRERVLNMLSPNLPNSGGTQEAEQAEVIHKGVLLRNLPEKFNTEAIKDALVDRKDIPLYAHNPAKGPAEAPVVIVEFSDISCQTCPDLYKNIKDVSEKYPEHIRWIHKHASLNPFGTNNLAAFYSKVANEHDLFWPYREQVRKLKDHTEDTLVGALSRAGLPVRNSQQLVRLHARQVYKGLDADLALTMRLGLKSPPAVLVNGIVIGGALPLEMLPDVVAYELQNAGVDLEPEENKKNKNAEKQN